MIKPITMIMDQVKANEPMNHVLYEIISEIKLACTTQQLSQRALSELSGVPQKTIARLENGEDTPTFETLGKLMKALRIQPSISFIHRH